jgi:thioredoxin 1
MADKLPATSDAAFDADVLKSDVPVLVDFWATWCGPCKAMAPHLQNLADELDGKLKVVKVDIGDNPETPSAYNVSHVPTLVLFKGGQAVDQHVGAANPSKLRDFVTRNL